MTREQILHEMYASVARANDAITCGDRCTYDEEVLRQRGLRRRFERSSPAGDTYTDLGATHDGKGVGS